ncbi:hypothetical protein HOLleu_17741 [Holothuria leucospilota]|uniref:Ig-like domain-containing protein n=1 Tax=Holothuria leucospilota TaxID=206669 RepID=A0A9Q1C2Q9_HOLLE|nr:hypothetical protein HOLleu_17741 [Holothuria leucospilota]
MLTNLKVAITLVFALPLVAATGSFDDCPSRQSGTLGQAATIKCSIGSNFSSVYWYRSNDMLVVCYDVGIRSEHQSENDDYVIESDGSLRINNVSSHHPTVYRVVFYDDENHIQKKRVRFLVNREGSISEYLERVQQRRKDLERKQQRREEKKRRRILQMMKKEERKAAKKEKAAIKEKRRQEKLKRKRERTKARGQKDKESSK